MMSTQIHPTAIVDPSAELAEGVSVDAYAIIDGQVEIGRDCRIGPYSRITGWTTIGARNRFESHCSIGAPPQDLKYDGEETRLEIGDGNTFREFVTIHRGTPGGGGITRIAHSSLFMAYVHIAHDCLVGSQTIFANAATLAGHVEVQDHATIGAFSAIHQFSRVGQYAFLGGFTAANKDCLPYMNTTGNRPAKCFGPNTIGLERKGFSEDSRKALKQLWRLLRSSKMTTTEAVAKAKDELAGQPEVDVVLEFIESSQRGVILA
jgi:UDP-N-acetylglucosamine acyltransferase